MSSDFSLALATCRAFRHGEVRHICERDRLVLPLKHVCIRHLNLFEIDEFGCFFASSSTVEVVIGMEDLLRNDVELQQFL